MRRGRSADDCSYSDADESLIVAVGPMPHFDSVSVPRVDLKPSFAVTGFGVRGFASPQTVAPTGVAEGPLVADVAEHLVAGIIGFGTGK